VTVVWKYCLAILYLALPTNVNGLAIPKLRESTSF